MNYNIAEVFYSLQGEGFWGGTPMLFIRLAGCNVGKYTPLPQIGNPVLRMLREKEPHLSVCTALTGEQFLCDTDYHSTVQVDLGGLDRWVQSTCEELVDGVPKHVCLTGGEPYLFDLEPLQKSLITHGVTRIHIETSGTKPIKRYIKNWVTCSPKEGYIANNNPLVDEWKVLVGPGTGYLDVARVVDQLSPRPHQPVYLSPINETFAVADPSVQRAKELCLGSGGTWKLSMQMHKVLGVR